MKPDRVIAFEGADGVGKTTLIKAVHGELARLGIPSNIFSSPGMELHSLGKLIYKLHHAPRSHDVFHISPTALQALHVAAHIDFLESPRHHSRTILLDRCWWSAAVYGQASGANKAALNLLVAAELQYWQTKKLVVVLMNRRPERANPPYSKIQRGYRILARREHGKYPIIRFTNQTDVVDGAYRLAARIKEVL